MFIRQNSFADISHYKSIDFNKYKSRMLICKATEGCFMIDPSFKKNQSSCREKGITFGAYHFFRVNTDAKIQAHHFLSTVVGFNFPPILDIETLDGQTNSFCKNAIADILKNFHQALDLIKNHNLNKQ